MRLGWSRSLSLFAARFPFFMILSSARPRVLLVCAVGVIRLVRAHTNCDDARYDLTDGCRLAESYTPANSQLCGSRGIYQSTSRRDRHR